jgi:hypothetical protein
MGLSGRQDSNLYVATVIRLSANIASPASLTVSSVILASESILHLYSAWFIGHITCCI